MQRSVLRNTQNNLAKVARYQEQLSSGKRILVMSDDPIGGRRALTSRIQMSQNGKFLDNIDKSLAFMDATDATMTEMVSVFDAAKKLAVQGANVSQDATSRKTLAQSVDAHLDRFIDLANAVHDGRYMFAGTASLDKPFIVNETRNDVQYHGDLDNFQVDISFGGRSVINQNGYDLWKSDVDVFQVMIDLRDALVDNDAEAVSGMIDELQSAANHINTLQGELGGRTQRLELTRRQLEESQVQLGALVSQQEDVDMAETIMQMQNSQVALEAALQAGARVIQPSLLDFL